MFLVEAIAALSVRASHERQRPARDEGEDVFCDLGVIFREPELGQPLALPKNAVRMGQPDACEFDVSAFCRLGGCARFFVRWPDTCVLTWHFELHLRCGLVLAQSLECGLPQSLILRPAAKLDFRDEFRLDENEAAPFFRRERFCEGRRADA